jgi:hypothetical protein
MRMMTLWQEFWNWLAPWNFWFDSGAAISAFVTAIFWLCASQVKMPPAGLEFVHPQFERAIMDMARRQNRLNSWAAGFSALTALLTSFGVSTTTFFHP